MTIESINFPSSFTKEQLDYITNYVAQQARSVFADSLRDVILYGSYARGDHQEWSDVDIMVLADADEPTCRALEKKLRKNLEELDYHMNGLLSPIVTPNSRFEYFGNYYPFYANVRKDGVRCVC